MIFKSGIKFVNQDRDLIQIPVTVQQMNWNSGKYMQSF
jgi:hypothetical protein